MSVSRDWGADVFRFAPRRARGAGRARQARLAESEVEGSTFRKPRTSNLELSPVQLATDRRTAV